MGKQWMKSTLALTLSVALVTGGCGSAPSGGPSERAGTRSEPLCNHGNSEGWVHRFNPFVAGRYVHDPALGQSFREVVADRKTTFAIGRGCGYPVQRKLIIEDEVDLNYEVGVSKLLAADVCGQTPTLIFKTYTRVEPDNPLWRRQNELPTYPFYVPGHLSATAPGNQVALNDVERALVFFTAVLARQCPQLPAAVRVVARDSYSRASAGAYTYRQFYSGTYPLRGELPELVHDNPAEAERLQAWTRQHNHRAAERAARQREANEQGAAMLFATMVGLAMYGPRCLILRMDGVCLKRE